MSEDRMAFQAEVNKLLDIVVHSLYSNKEIFLRELISNASDACDRLRYLALSEPALLGEDAAFAITITPDKKARTLTVADNGIGMSRDDLINNLGTIARSGTEAFVKSLSGDSAGDVSLIGQFGVGFYSAFMVAEKVEVLTRRAGDETGWRWSSDGQGDYVVAEHKDVPRGTRIVLHLRKDAGEFLEPARLRTIIKTYSDHIAIPIRLKGDDGKEETVNEASALWTRPKSEITADQYKEFYHHAAHAFDDPWLTLHYRAEGAIEYTALLFVPSMRPFDLFHPERKQHVKLYVKRVFITDDCEGLLPGWLRFVRGIVDSQDLPLNISRETLQHNPILAKIRSGLVKRILAELGKRAEKDEKDYATFWETFGAVLKEGLYEDHARQGDLLPLCRFRSTGADGWVSLEEYRQRMKDGQKAIYVITGDDPERLAKSPHLEGYRARGVEVLILTDPVDEFWITGATFDDKPFRLVTQGAADLDDLAEDPSKDKEDAGKDAAKTGERAEDGKAVAELVAALKTALGDAVADVRCSPRLTESAVCLVAAEGGMSLHLERMLRAHGEPTAKTPRVLEINPRHPLIQSLAAQAPAAQAKDTDTQGIPLDDAAHLLLDQARILEGEPVPDPAAFSRRLTAALEKGLAA